MAAETINIQVCYASEAAQFLRALQVPPAPPLNKPSR
jgi:hypothetical protein